MDMEIIFFEYFRQNPGCFSNGPDVTHPDHGGFLHHIPHLARQLDLSLAGHPVHLNLQGVASHTGPGKPADNSHLGFSICFVQAVLLFAKIMLQIRSGHTHLSLRFPVFLLFQYFNSRFPQNVADLTLQIPDACLFSVKSNDVFQGTVLDGKYFFRNTVFLHLLMQQMFLSDMEFFIFRVAADLNDLHPIQ